MRIGKFLILPLAAGSVVLAACAVADTVTGPGNRGGSPIICLICKELQAPVETLH